MNLEAYVEKIPTEEDKSRIVEMGIHSSEATRTSNFVTAALPLVRKVKESSGELNAIALLLEKMGELHPDWSESTEIASTLIRQIMELGERV